MKFQPQKSDRSILPPATLPATALGVRGDQIKGRLQRRIQQRSSLLVDIPAPVNHLPANHFTAHDAASLRTAIAAANASLAPMTITLTNSVTLTAPAPNSGNATGLPIIQSAITIEGAGYRLMRANDAPPFRLFRVASTGNLTLNAITVIGGCTNNGGGIYNQGTVTLNNSMLSCNSANFSGGGIYNQGTVTLKYSIISDNCAGDGGGIFSFSTLLLYNSSIRSNSAMFSGGGIFSFSTLLLHNSSVSGNSAMFSGGGIYNKGTLTLSNSSVSGNSAGFTDGDSTNHRLIDHDSDLGTSNFAPPDCDYVPHQSC